MGKKGKEKATPAAPTQSASGSGSSKKSSKKASNNNNNNNTAQNDDFIVFTNSTKDPKPKKDAQAQAPAIAGKPGADEGEASGPPKPTVKQIIGGASWTGKLPVNLLSEHCQRQKWEKPDYQPVCDDRLLLNTYV